MNMKNMDIIQYINLIERNYMGFSKTISRAFEEEGTANQRQIDKAFYSSYDFVDANDIGKSGAVNADKFRNNCCGEYSELLEKIKTNNPDMDNASIPFMAADILREVYEEEEKDV